MGQIDHARRRVAELKAAKLGFPPDRPKIKGGSTILKEIRKDGRTISNAQINKAYFNYIGRVISPNGEVDGTTSGYGEGRKTTYKLVDVIPSSFENALATLVYAVENTAEVKRWEMEKELFDLRAEAVNIKASEVEDSIVLGNQAEALKALNDFAAFEL